MIDVTDQVEFNNPDDELLPLTKCVCGKTFESWDFNIGVYDDMPTECSNCGRKFVFENNVKVFQVE